MEHGDRELSAYGCCGQADLSGHRDDPTSRLGELKRSQSGRCHLECPRSGAELRDHSFEPVLVGAEQINEIMWSKVAL